MEEKRWSYPRPLLRRKNCTSPNGQWEFPLDHEAHREMSADVVFDREIQLPFAPETPARGIAFKGYVRASWYRREVGNPNPEGRIRLHYGSIDSPSGSIEWPPPSTKADTNPTYSGQLERGVKTPSLRTILALAAELDVFESKLVKRVETLLRADIIRQAIRSKRGRPACRTGERPSEGSEKFCNFDRN
jgi:hypothetical protein